MRNLSVVGVTKTFRSIKEKSHLAQMLKSKYKGVTLTFLEDKIMYEYKQSDDHSMFNI